MRASQIVQLLIMFAGVLPATVDLIQEFLRGPGSAFISDEHKAYLLGAMNVIAAFLPRFRALLSVFGGANESTDQKS